MSATTQHQLFGSSLSIESHDDPTHGFTSMFNVKVDLYRQSGTETTEETYLVGDDRSLRCLSLLRENEENPDDERKEHGDD